MCEVRMSHKVSALEKAVLDIESRFGIKKKYESPKDKALSFLKKSKSDANASIEKAEDALRNALIDATTVKAKVAIAEKILSSGGYVMISQHLYSKFNFKFFDEVVKHLLTSDVDVFLSECSPRFGTYFFKVDERCLLEMVGSNVDSSD